LSGEINLKEARCEKLGALLLADGLVLHCRLVRTMERALLVPIFHPMLSAIGCVLLRGVLHNQNALRFRNTSKNVLIKIWMSSQRLQLLMYHRSISTRRAI
jgi:hypothetical protein